MKKLFLILSLALTLSLFFACARPDGGAASNPPAPSADGEFTFADITEYLTTYGFIKETDLSPERRVTRPEALTMAAALTGAEPGEYSGGESDITTGEFVCLLLTAMGYDDPFGHFSLSDPWRLSEHIGLTKAGDENSGLLSFSDMTRLSFNALRTSMRNSSVSMYYYYFVYKKFPPVTCPEVFDTESELLFSTDRFDEAKEISAGGSASGTVYYNAAQPIELSLSVSDSSVISVELTDYHAQTEESGVYIQQNYRITGLAAGYARLALTFSEGQGNPRAIAIVDVWVS